MQLHHNIDSTILQITNYSSNKIDVNGTAYSHSIVLQPTHVAPWSMTHLNELDFFVHLEPYLNPKPELVLIGTGETLRWPHPAISAHLMQARIGCEIMTTTSACRTYNILALDGRQVIAFIYLG